MPNQPRCRRVLVALLALGLSTPLADAASVLMVTQNVSLNAHESGRKTQLEAWGHTVTTIVDSATQTAIDTAVAAADVVYVPGTVDDWELLHKLRTANKGVVVEPMGLDTEFGFATADGYTESRSQVFNLINSHDVTAGLSSGTVTIASSNQNLSNNGNTLAAGMVKLAEGNWGGLGLGVIEAGGTLANTHNGNSTASGRRVRLPWGWDVSISSLNANGLTILRQAINWVVGKQLVAHWKLDAPSGTTALDYSGNGHTGTVTGTATWVSAIRNNGFSFNGSTKIQASGLMGGPADITVAAWANLTTADTNGAEIISLGDRFILRLDESGATKVTFWSGSTWRTASVSQNFAGTGWHHFAATFDDGANWLRLYVDGLQVASLSTTSSISYSGGGSNTVIGRNGNSGTNHDFTGVVDDVRVYNYALTAAEIVELYGFLGHWKLIQTSGTTATDSSPNANNGTYTNGVTLNQTGPYPGAGSKAARFDGNNDYVAVPNESKYDSVTDEATVAAWIKVDAFDLSWQTVISKGDGTWRLQRDGTTNYLAFGCSGLSNTKVVSSTSVNDGQWHHVAGVYNGSTLRIYIDGVLDASVSATGTISTNNHAVRIGENSEQTGRYWEGRIHDVRVYNRALNAWEIAQLYGLIGHWKLTETSGTSAADSSLAANNGTYTNGVVLNSSGPYPGMGSKAATFDGLNDYVAIPNEYRYDVTDALAVTAWIKVNAFDSTYQALVTKGISSWRLTRDGTDNVLRFACNGLSTTSVSGVTPVDDGKWHHVAGMYDGSSLKLYVDGQLDNSANATGSISTNNIAAAIGRYMDSTGTEWDGRIHDVRLYNRAINASDIAEMYGLVGRWMLSETAGAAAADETLFTNNGTYTGGVTLNTTGPTSGTVAAQFDGYNDHVVLPTTSNFSNGYSIAVWARPTSANSWARFVEYGAGTDSHNFFLVRRSTSSYLQTAIHDSSLGGTQRLEVNGGIINDAWHQYVATVDSTGVARLYRDKVELASGTIGTPQNVARTSNYVGRSNWGADSYYQGQMYDVRVYNRPMSADEITEHYDGGANSFEGVKIIRWLEIQ